MVPWLESLGVALVALTGVYLGVCCSRMRHPYWLVGYFVPLTAVLMVGATRRYEQLSFTPPFSWLTVGRVEYVVLALGLPTLFLSILWKLKTRREQGLMLVFLAILLWWFTLSPFLQPAWNRAHFERMKTVIDINGVCQQSEEYTCGPAAAVTLLRKLGFPAEEGELAVLAHTSNAAGTPSDLLCEALEARYGGEGLTCRWRFFSSLAELRTAGPTIAIVKYKFLVDHYVAVMDMTDRHVILGDPLKGKRTLTLPEFAAIWRFSGIELRGRPARLTIPAGSPAAPVLSRGALKPGGPLLRTDPPGPPRAVPRGPARLTIPAGSPAAPVLSRGASITGAQQSPLPRYNSPVDRCRSPGASHP
ncbi:MAG: hypothetical protein HY815_07395 [Candidatus Riflebacteria bacterium]|nr:hypothetical protein [Candidatus Riflebacteria bacterium]